jgi:single-stranded-DNA-specific exonuclease
VVEQLGEGLGVCSMTARALVCRGISELGEARVFLGHDLEGLIDPFQMKDMDRAVAAVDAALARGARIRIYGDYDVDGVCATALLVRALKGLGGKVDSYIPHRIDEGYGVNEEAVRQARAEGVDLLITVDCGSTAVAPIALARELGMEVVVTDHHRPGDELPEAPVLNPCRDDCGYPFKDLAGVGVAFKLVAGLARARGVPEGDELRFLDLVCLGTVADVVPLLGENRLFVQHGLRRLATSRKVGIRELMRAAKVGREPPVKARDVAFGLAPRINAAGRMEDAEAAVRLMLTGDLGEAQALATQLSEHNEARRAEERKTLEEAEAMVASGVDLDREKVIVLGSEGWHAGVIGIVASRLVERHHRPCLLVAIADGIGKGSGRSISAFNLWEALRECAPALTRFGGHRYAAGFGIEATRMEELRRRINEVAEERLSADDLVRQVEIDAEVALEDLTLKAVDELNRLAPFGLGNPTPMLVARGVRVDEVRPVGDGSHLSLKLRGEGGGAVDGIWFRSGALREELESGGRADVCFRAQADEWNGTVRVQLHVEDVALWDGD